MVLRTISAFTGGYGLELGLELAFPGAFEPILYVEIDVQAAGLLAALMEKGLIPKAPIWSDIQTVVDARVRAYVRAATGDQGVEVITAGYPCPDFSTAGKRKGLAGEKGKLWFALARAIRAYRPGLVFLENVGGHLRCGFQRVRSDLRRMGYRVEAGLFTAEEVGASQKRERLFVLAYRGFAAMVGGKGTRRGRRGKQGAAGPKRCRGREAQTSSGDLASFPLFPPQPDSLADWLDVLQNEIGLAPAVGKEAESEIRGVADGLASRVDRLRVLGNGASPLQVAYAFRTLLAAAGIGVGE